MDRHQFAVFAEEIAHELRTPLSVIFGDIDLALACDRSPAAYRESLARIAERVTQLLDLTGDLSVLGEPVEGSDVGAGWASLRAVFAALSERYGPRRGSPVTVGAPDHDWVVPGDELLLTGALSLFVEHALRHRRDESRVRLRAVPPAADARFIDLVLDAEPDGFGGSAWRGLPDGFGPDPPARGPLLLAIAADVIRTSGGTLEFAKNGVAEGVRIRLRLLDEPDDSRVGLR